MTIYEEIARERNRQIHLGFNVEHDDQHSKRELIRESSWGVIERLTRGVSYSNDYYRSVLIVCATMIVAEIQRIDRIYLPIKK